MNKRVLQKQCFLAFTKQKVKQKPVRINIKEPDSNPMLPFLLYTEKVWLVQKHELEIQQIYS